MFRKITKKLSVALFLVITTTVANAKQMNFFSKYILLAMSTFNHKKEFNAYCKIMKEALTDDLILKKLQQNEKLTEGCDKGNAPVCLGEMEAAKMIAEQTFTGNSYNYAINLLNKEGINNNISKTEMVINYYNFFDYLKNKVEKMNKEKRVMLLDKFYLFFNRVLDSAFDPEVQKYIKESEKKKSTFAGAYNFTFLFAATLFNKDTEYLDATISNFRPSVNLRYLIIKRGNGSKNKDAQLGFGADNIDKFFVYVVTKQYDKAIELVNNTYSDSFVKNFIKTTLARCQ